MTQKYSVGGIYSDAQNIMTLVWGLWYITAKTWLLVVESKCFLSLYFWISCLYEGVVYVYVQVFY